MTRHQTHRWIDVLDSVTKSYNGSYHRSIKMAPSAVSKRDEPRLWQLQYGPSKYRQKSISRFAFKKGDTVRISHVRQPFDSEYQERWTQEYFVVDDREVKEGIPYYTLKDTMGDDVHGTFYQSELNGVNVTANTKYRVEKAIRTRGNQVLVRWTGWLSKFDSWIYKSNLQNYKRN